MGKHGRFLALFVGAGIAVLAGEAPPMQELQPRPVQFSAARLPLADALKQLQEQTGNAVADRRAHATNPLLATKPGLFWPTLDAIGTATGIGFSAYQEGGGVALVDTPYRPLKTDYRGIFRIAVKRIAVSRDDETQAHQCHLALDVAWEPRLQALYLNLDHAEVRAGKRSEKVERQAARSVAGASAAEIELTMPAPERAVPKIDTVRGAFRVIGVPRMLEFAFAKLKNGKPLPVQSEIDKVKVSMTYLRSTPTRWTVDLHAEYPPGAIVPLGSFQQTWMDNNRVWLSWGIDPKTQKPHELEAIGGRDEGTGMRFEFTARENRPLPPANADVTLRYRTPNRVVALTAPFEFKDLPLP